MLDLSKLHDAILKGDAEQAKSLTIQALDSGADPKMMLDEYMIPAMNQVGALFEECQYFVPELLISARAMKVSLGLIKPLLTGTDKKMAATIAIGTVKGDLHDIGKNLVAAMLEGGGFEVVDLGVDVQTETFVKAIVEGGAHVIALSALLTTTMPAMKQVVEAIESAGLRDKVRILVGGAPVTQKFADSIGADGYGETASSAVSLSRSFLVSSPVACHSLSCG